MPIALTQFPRAGSFSVTQGYGGDTSHNLNPWSVDFTAAAGTPVLSVLSGTVVGIRTGSFTGDANAGGYGNFVTILHTGGFYATYAHLTSDSVSLGQTVSAGTQIGLSGSTGATQGAHIHVHFGTDSSGGPTMQEGTGNIFRAFGGNDAVPPAFFAAFFGADEVGPYVDVSNPATILSTDIFGTGNWGGSPATDSDELRGTSANNRIFGGAGPDRLFGEGGDDLLVGGTGDDSFDGGPGNDTLSVAYSASNWTISFVNGTAVADGITETFVSIENVTGGSGADLITTSSENINNTIDGRGGSDRVVVPYVFGQGYTVSGSVGNFVLSGSAGIDTFIAIENVTFSNGITKTAGEVLGSSSTSGSVSISDVTLNEGDSGTRTATFTVTRTGGTAAFNVGYATADGTATTADGDYAATSGTLQFGANVNTQTIAVTINGDTKVEQNETFVVNLSAPTNGATLSDSQGVGTITNDDQSNSAPNITSNGGGASASLSVAENTTFVTTVRASDPDGTTPTYSISGGADQARFAISSATGVLSFVSAPNFEAPSDADANNTYIVQVRASDGALSDVQTISVNVTDVAENGAPISGVDYRIFSGGTATNGIDVAALRAAGNQFVVEYIGNTPNNGYLRSSDVDVLRANGLSIVSVYERTPTTIAYFTTQNALFDAENSIAAANLAGQSSGSAIYFTIDEDFVSQADIAAIKGYFETINSYFQSHASPYRIGAYGSGFELTSLLNDAASGVAFTWLSQSTGWTGYSTFTAANMKQFATTHPSWGPPSGVDPDLAFTANYGQWGAASAPGVSFAVSSVSGAEGDTLTFRISVVNPQYSLTPDYLIFYNTTDGSASAGSDYTGIGNQVSLHFTASSAQFVDVAVSTKTDADPAEGPEYFNFNVYDFNHDLLTQVRGEINDRALANNAPVIVSNGGGVTASVAVAENATAVATVVASDPDPGTVLGFSLAGGADQARFQINASTGALSFVAAPNYEAPGSAAGTNTYVVQVRVADNGSPALSDTQTISVSVTDANDNPPVITTGATQSIAENSTFVAALVSTDVDTVGTNPSSFSITGGADAVRFVVLNGNLAFSSAPDFENPGDADHNNSYIVQVTASDGVNLTSKTITVNLFDVNEIVNRAPAITSNGAGDAASVSISENATAITTVVATDPDVGTVLTYSLSGGADQGKFQINSSTGALSFLAAPDYEAAGSAAGTNSYSVQVRVSDNGNPSLSDTQMITVNIADVNDTAPTITTASTQSILENTTSVGTLTSTDPDGVGINPAVFSISGGADGARFNIVNANLAFATALDFENPADADHNNSYIVQVSASDGANVTNKTITVNVGNVVETIFSPVTATLPSSAENLTLVGTADINGTGNAGDNVITGNDGSNALAGGAGNDTLRGNFGFDTGLFSAARSAYSIANNGATVTVTGPDGTDTLFGIERLQFSDVTLPVGRNDRIDLNIDGRTDVLWRHSDGSVATWLGGGQANGQGLGSVATSWSLTDGQADYDGDGSSDILWRNSDGTVAAWMASTQANGQMLGSLSASWRLVDGHADFNGDGRSDILWRNSDGAVGAWLAGLQTNGQSLGAIDTGWSIADGESDFNGDGKSDILWRNRDGAVATWLGGAQANGQGLGALATSWTIIDARGDYNGDGRSDILWRLGDGTVATWLSGTQANGQTLGALPTSWRIVDGRGDYNGDGRSDILWRNSDGTVGVWFSGLQSNGQGLGALPATWSIVDGHGDYNADGRSDVLWMNADGTVGVWLGGSQTNGQALGIVPAGWSMPHAAGVNATAPSIATAANRSIAENSIVAAVLTSTDLDTIGQNPASFSISGGVDAGRFNIVGADLVFAAVPDFENPTDADGDNTYLVQVSASDGVNVASKLLTVNVTNVIETLSSAVTAALPSSIENLTLTGTADISGTGNSVNNVMVGNDGSNVLAGLAGNDTLIGGLGLDTALFAGPRGAYSIAQNGAAITVSGPDGVDTLNGIERLQFPDASLSIAGNAHIDFNADFRSDILWRHADGTVAMWRSGAQTNGEPLGAVPTSWSIVDGHGDFNGDGTSDILWRNTHGTVATWLGGRQANGQLFGALPTSWSILDAHGDYNGDGRSDILWRNTDGTVGTWLAGAQTNGQGFGAIPAGWGLIDGHADFNGDGSSDLLWRNSDGAVGTWLAGSQANGQALGAVAPSWSIVDADGDYNGDGRSDILWRNNDGTVATWLSGAQANGLTLGVLSTSWSILDGHGDYDGDGKSDLLWRNADGTVATWLSGAQANGQTLGSLAATWRLAEGHADFNGDGRSDILWRNDDGSIGAWLGGSQAAGQSLGTIPGGWSMPDSAEVAASIRAAGSASSGTVGRDSLYGSGIGETLAGGPGADRFVFDTPLNATNVDTLLDFESGTDKLVLGDVIFTALPKGPLAASSFVREANVAAHDADDFILYDTNTGTLAYDADGAGIQVPIVFAALFNAVALQASDLYIGVA